MAKRRRLSSATRRNEPKPRVESGPDIEPSVPLVSGVAGFNPMAIALGLLAGSLVYVVYYPSDSVAVEQGDSLWFTLLAIVIATVAYVAASVAPQRSSETAKLKAADSAPSPLARSETREGPSLLRWRARFLQWGPRVLRWGPWALAGWMMLAAFGSSPPGNLRMATNEAWLWVAAACVFSSSRLVLSALDARRSILGLVIVCAVGLSVHGLHQYFVSLPTIRAEYRDNPEEVLRTAMLDAPPGSSERMVFENRLIDGGPTATFALANSLAGVLLVGVILCAGGMLLGWREFSVAQRVGWLACGLLCAGCLMATRSRSATVALLIAMALLLVAATRFVQQNRRFMIWGMAGLGITSAVVTGFLALFGNREWFEQAPASLAFRFQYWRSTWHMVLDHPLFGCGPGNFQSIYERYREATATEQIAEPHNLLFETLASGGFVGLSILLVTIAAGLWWAYRRMSSAENVEHGEPNLALARWTWLGAIASLALIWTLGWISRRTPELDASLYIIPAAFLSALFIAGTIKKITARDLDVLATVALIAIGIHLMISGGWTVPGVAILPWLLAGMLLRVPEPDVTAAESKVSAADHRWLKPASYAFAGALMILFLWRSSLHPVETRDLEMSRAANAQRSGRPDSALRSLQTAVEADKWSADASLWLADYYRWRLIADGDNPEIRRRWSEALAESRSRAGEDPAAYRMIGGQQVHVFQMLGSPEDIEAASETFETALAWTPSNEWMHAQVAAIRYALGDREGGDQAAAQARNLSELGGNIERALARQMVYIPKKVGIAARSGPVRANAESLLSEPNPPSGRNSAD